MYVVVWSLSKIWTAFFNSSDQTLSNGTCVSRILMRVFETDYGREKGLLLRYTSRDHVFFCFCFCFFLTTPHCSSSRDN